MANNNQSQEEANNSSLGIEQTPAQSDFNIELTYPPPTEEPATSYAPVSPTSEPYAFHQAGNRIVCERCGNVLHSDDLQCSGCGMPNTMAETSKPESYPPPPPQQPQQRARQTTPPPPYTPPSPYAPRGPYAPQPTDPRAQAIPKPDPKKGRPPQQGTAAKCAKCGALVYEHETRCSNCGRILAPPKTAKPQPGGQKGPYAPVGKAPAGTARCSKCNAVVYPHQTNCANCNKRLEPVSAPRGPGQRVSRCKRCGHTVYPTDQVCPNCNRKLNPI